MPKTLGNIHELVESDFRVIQELLEKKYDDKFTVGYIRKVCKGKRSNSTIKIMAEKYLDVLNEMTRKINRLSK